MKGALHPSAPFAIIDVSSVPPGQTEGRPAPASTKPWESALRLVPKGTVQV